MLLKILDIYNFDKGYDDYGAINVRLRKQQRDFDNNKTLLI